MTESLEQLTASALLGRLKNREISVESLVRSCLERQAKREPSLHAWSYIDPEALLHQAREMDRNGPHGPLYGLPIGIKDVLLTKDMPTQYNSPLYENFAPQVDASCVSLLRQAGALIFGKTETAEFASSGRLAPTCNPHDFLHTPGGSSSGSAAAVADFHVPLAIGTQTGGSMIRPASFCGIYAFKPTWGVVNPEGAKIFSPSMDTLGWFGRCVDDLILLNDVLDPQTEIMPEVSLSCAHIAICRSPVWSEAEPSTRLTLEQCAERLQRAGARVTELVLPEIFNRLPELQKLIMLSEGRASFFAQYREDKTKLHPNICAQVENSAGYTRQQLREAYDVAAQCRALFDALADQFDAIVTPSTPGVAPLGTQGSGSMIFNGLWSLLHTPCVNIPVPRAPGELPLGLTITAARFTDRHTLAAAKAIAQ